ncbi:MAG: T9SS type A sorting domain-containing protein, partial [Cyclonatronaceae bacterium]
YFWRVRAENNTGAGEWSEFYTFTTQMATSIEDEPGIPTEFTLSQNYPNPFNPTTIIEFGIPQASPVRLEVYNTIGQRVAILVNEQRTAGTHRVTFDGAGLASGLYIYRIQAGGFVQTRKLTLIK